LDLVQGYLPLSWKKYFQNSEIQAKLEVSEVWVAAEEESVLPAGLLADFEADF